MTDRSRDRRTRGRGKGRGKYIPRRKVCIFCADKSLTIDYKDVQLLSRFVSDRGRIDPRRKTGNCPKHQRALSVAIKRARFIALLPYTAEHLRQTGAVIHEHPRSEDRHYRGRGERRPRPEAEPAKETSEKEPKAERAESTTEQPE
jgi:small subunit ribosomal protein S18